MWVSLRMRGLQAFDVNDLLIIARALDMGVHELMPPPEVAAGAASPPAIPRYLEVPVRMETQIQRPPDNRPSGGPGLAHSIGGARTTYVTRRPRGRRD